MKASVKKFPFPLLLVAVLLLVGSVHGRLISEFAPDLISDGLKRVHPPSFLRLGSLSASQICEQTYGFLPCTTSVVGNLFLVAVYGYLMFQAATCLSTGSELLLALLGPGIIGGLFLPVLGALPDAILILVSGLSGSKETAQDQVLIGMGLLAGSTVMLLTVLWGSCVVVGKVSLTDGSASTGIDLTGSGVTTDQQTSHAAKIMVISVVPFLIVQLPRIFHLSSGSRLVVLISLIVSIVFLLSYCFFQVYQPWVQSRRLAYAKRKHIISGLLRHLHKESLGKLLRSDGEPNIQLIEKLFKRIDTNSNNVISASELRSLAIGIQFVGQDLDPDDAVNKMMEAFDTSNDKVLDQNEFVTGICDWISKAKSAVSYKGEFLRSVMSGYHEITKVEYDTLLDDSDEVVESVDNPTWVVTKAVFLLFLGTVIAAVFADPLVDAVHNFSGATGIPSFFISFIAMPLATNSSEAVSALIFASRKKKRSTSLTFSEIYGAVTMNNTLCLAVFLAVVYVRHLTWDFSSEVLVILIVSVIMGLLGSFRTKFPLWTCSVAYLLYPLSLLLVYVLDYFFGLERRGFAGSSPAAAEKAQQDQHQKMWCVAKNNAEDGALQAAIDWACGPGGADCAPIQQGGDCFDPQDIQSHASYAFNDYFLKHGLDPQACVFNGAAEVTMLNPSQGKCVLPSGSFVQNSNITGSRILGWIESPETLKKQSDREVGILNIQLIFSIRGIMGFILEALQFVTSFEFWRMAVLWPLALLFSYLELLIGKGYTFRRRPVDTSLRPLCIITGATSGLGAAVANHLVKEGFYVILAGRSDHSLDKVVEEIKLKQQDSHIKAFQVNLSSFKSIMQFRSSLEQWLVNSNMECSIQLLINNAGILATSHRFTPDGYDQMMETNYIGAFALTCSLLPLLRNSSLPSRIVNITSFTHRCVSDIQFERDLLAGRKLVPSLGFKRYPFAHIYEYSKFCMLLFSYELHRRLQLKSSSYSISVMAADPGVVKTQIMREVPSLLSRLAFTVLGLLRLLQNAESGMESIIDAALAPKEASGMYFFGGKGRTIKSHRLSYDTKLGDKLWTNSLSLLKDHVTVNEFEEISS
ncbi:hypothetical protein H6P81_012254 [Aristolochia fimbriata]|uniref:EF-hand domain-containing protein n=1 Tax=Aristolochia fimbriata TaxID=158543 RepID=A0AAV7EE31_ARIFI|nr:hypothetical protein H6P81_012254 [Aristolochia fimbriata]